ncbi:MAG: response regulator transcription factor [Acidobacteria bacterium]|nr:response regulator transcription factor [Acidobacteriota bacterium]
MLRTEFGKTVAVCETQPITVEGLRAFLNSSPDLEFAGAADSLEAVETLVRERDPSVLLLDKAFGLPAVSEKLALLRERHPRLPVVVWGGVLADAEALRLLQAGARGILRKTADLRAILACLRSVSEGSNWMEDCVFSEAVRATRTSRSELTPREHQVMELVEQGLKNKEIAQELDIRPGTVKIHLKHIFEKTGVRGRYGLALTGLRDKGLLTLPLPAGPVGNRSGIAVPPAP